MGSSPALRVQLNDSLTQSHRIVATLRATDAAVARCHRRPRPFPAEVASLGAGALRASHRALREPPAGRHGEPRCHVALGHQGRPGSIMFNGAYASLVRRWPPFLFWFYDFFRHQVWSLRDLLRRPMGFGLLPFFLQGLPT